MLNAEILNNNQFGMKAMVQAVPKKLYTQQKIFFTPNINSQAIYVTHI